MSVHAEHGHGGSHGHESRHGGEENMAEKLPLVGNAVKMLRTIASKDGLKDFLNKMAEYSVSFAMNSYNFISELFGVKGGGGGHGGHGGGHGHGH